MTPVPPGRGAASVLTALASSIPEGQVRRIIAVTGNLPPVPDIVAEVLELAGNEETSVGDLEQVVSEHPAFAARILQVANGVFFDFDRKSTTLAHAIAALGVPAVRSTAIATAARRVFVKPSGPFGLQEKLLWEHSVGVATGCRQIARTVRHEDEETAFLVGLLHDVGKAVLRQAIPKRYGRIVEHVHDDARPFADVEREALGFDHSHVGALLVRKWSLAEEMVDVIALHHRPEARSCGVLASILALSNHLAKRLGIGLERVPEGRSVADHWSAAKLGLDGIACREIQEVMKAGLEDEKTSDVA